MFRAESKFKYQRTRSPTSLVGPVVTRLGEQSKRLGRGRDRLVKITSDFGA